MSPLIQMLKRIKHKLTRFAVAAFVACCKCLPVRRRVLFYTIRADGRLLENIRCVFDACDCKKVVFAYMLPHGFLLSLRARYLMLTSRVIVTDDYLKYCRDSSLHPGQKLIQLWHAPGAFKCFGLDAPSSLTPEEEIRTHAQYTDVCVSSEYVRPFYAGAFGVPLDVVRPLGVPRTDALLDDTRRAEMKRELLSRVPSLKGKTVYLYAPTFREQNGAPQAFDPALDFAALDMELREDECFVITRHPVMKEAFFTPGRFSRVLDLTQEPTGGLLCCADVLLTDYSSLLFDASLMGVPTVFYCPDKASYERSFYLDFDRDLPGPVTTQPAEVLPLLRSVKQSVPLERIREFCRLQTSACDGHATQRIAARILSYLYE